MVFIHTNQFKANEPQYVNSINFFFDEATDDTSLIIAYAKRCISTIYKEGFKYNKVGIMLLKLIPNSYRQKSLFSNSDKKTQLMKTVDKINQLMGRNSVFFCAEGITKRWSLKRDRKSPCYTTRLNELLIAKCQN